MAALAAGKKASQWIVAFALETEDQRLRAMQKLERKSCDLIVVNGPEAIHAADTRVEILGRDGQVLGSFSGSKAQCGQRDSWRDPAATDRPANWSPLPLGEG